MIVLGITFLLTFCPFCRCEFDGVTLFLYESSTFLTVDSKDAISIAENHLYDVDFNLPVTCVQYMM